jgi:hypothetical protein
LGFYFRGLMLERALRAVDEIFGAAAIGAPRILELIATVPEAKRALAWSAARQSYLQTARTLGYDEHDAQQWASEIISRLQIAFILRKS